MTHHSDAWIDKTLDGRYTLRRRIGKGGMGVVYEAEQPALDRRVAVKLIAAKEAPEDYLSRFRREAKLASRVAHQHLVHVYDVGTDRETGADYIVMELVEGKDLREELAGGALSFARARVIARQLLSALAAVHDAGIVHRDIKPANVMLTARGDERDRVKLMDFGVARGVDDASLTATGFVVGTASYMAPEQLRGQPIDHRSDLYAVGVTLFVMLAGRLPFDGNTAAVAGAHVFQAPPSLVALRPGTPPQLAAVVDRALAKSPGDRFPDARAFAAALDAIETSAPPRDDTPATVVDRPTAAPRPSRSRAPWIAAIAVAAALGGAIGFVARGGFEHAAPPPTPEVAAPSPPPPPRPAPEPSITATTTPPPPADPVPSGSARAPIADSTAPPAAAKPGAKPAPAGAVAYCQCIPTSAPDVYALCPKPGRPLCRCDESGGRSLCPAPLQHQRSCETFEGKTTCKVLSDLECPDHAFADFHVPGSQGDACTGYRESSSETWFDPAQHAGQLDCDACPGVPQDTYRGRPGEACTGYYWRTGEQKAGTLAHCGDRS